MTATVLTAVTDHWSFDAQIIIPVLLAAVLYWRGTHGAVARVPAGHRMERQIWHSALFYLALFLLVLALQSPIDYWSQYLMWVHMVQHLTLILLVPSLALLGDPGLPLLRGIPLALRRRLLAAAMGWRWLHLLALVFDRLLRPVPAFCLTTATLWAWHWPPLYNLTLRDQGVHDLEHVAFLATSLLFWWQIIDQTAARRRLSYGRRSIYIFCTAVQNHLLAVTLAFAPLPLYAYSRLAVRPGGISALTDQQIAGGIMWVPGMLLYGAAFLVCMYKWLSAQHTALDIPTLTPSLLASGDPVPAPTN